MLSEKNIIHNYIIVMVLEIILGYSSTKKVTIILVLIMQNRYFIKKSCLFIVFLSPQFPSLKLSSLNESHLDLVTVAGIWLWRQQLMIKIWFWLPLLLCLDSNDQPVAWILTYASCALGMLYTLPEHRGKGYAKALVTIMSETSTLKVIRCTVL